jgi:two-component system, chemotaxis family, protein-glutamate methylesterase/glutaminase
VPALRVMICDDSPGYALALGRLLEHDGDIAVVGCGETAQETMARLGTGTVDLITVDAGSPVAGGLAAVEEIMSSRPLPVLVLVSAARGRAEQASAALAAGAVDAIGKDAINLAEPAGPNAAALRERVRLLARTHVIRHPRARLRRRAHPALVGRRVAAIGFCASTGGPNVLATVLSALPTGYPIPLLIVQHISAGFSAGLVRWLDHVAGPPVHLAAHGAPVGPGAWIASEGANLRLGHAGRLELDDAPDGRPYQPSGDVLLASIAEVAGPGGIAVVLTGMGSDGAEGAAAVRRSGGFAIAQDEASSAVYGMPKAAAEKGVNLVLSPHEIGSYLAGLRYQPLAAAR